MDMLYYFDEGSRLVRTNDGVVSQYVLTGSMKDSEVARVVRNRREYEAWQLTNIRRAMKFRGYVDTAGGPNNG